MLRAANATVQIESRGCGGVLFGSGFPVADRLVITNAHVVAGSRRHEVVTNTGGRSGPASSTSTRPTTWPCCRSPTCRCGPAPGHRGGQAGPGGGGDRLPSGGPQKIIGARVVLRTRPEAPDIYSSSRYRRDIYILHALIRKGVSGGPVVDLRGRPLGVVFAASTADNSEGYALTNAEVRRALDRNGGNRQPVPVGDCAV